MTLNRRHLARLHRRNARRCLVCGRPTCGTPSLNSPTCWWQLCGLCKANEDAIVDARLANQSALGAAVDRLLDDARRAAVATRARIEGDAR